MNKEKKLCKICESYPKYANTNFCYKCYREREKLKKEEKARLKKERKESTKGFQRNLKRLVHDRTWKLMSLWIRKKDANADGLVQCYTCGIWKHWKETNAGHFKHDRLDFDERNLKVQCVACNKYYSGRLDVYAEKLINENGIDWFNKLVKDAWSHTGYSNEEMLKIEEDLKNKLTNL